MKLLGSSEAPGSLACDWLAIALFEGEPAPAGLGLEPLLESAARSKDFQGGAGEFLFLPGPRGGAAEGVAVAGLGPREKVDAAAAYSAGIAVSKRLAAKPRGRVAVHAPGLSPELTDSWIQGLIVGTRAPDLMKSEKVRHAYRELVVVGRGDDHAGSRRAEILAEGINLARELANLPPARKTPTQFARLARERGEAVGLTVTIWDEDRIRSESFGGLLGVAAGSDQPPAFAIVEHRRGPSDVAPVAIVGKGVTFDSGGLSLKPSASMEDMKADMSGAAITLATLICCARLEIPVNVVGYIPLTENMTGGRAMKLGDVLTMRDGKTVEVLNTDAEGRLILADALAYAVEHKPRAVVDLATLTGACLVALGPRIAGLFANDESLAGELGAAAKESGERVWRLPLDEDFRDMLKSQVADMKNVGGKWGGAITAAKFLQQFVGETPWAHLDIAGPSWSDSETPALDAGATGCMVRTLIRFLEGRR